MFRVLYKIHAAKGESAGGELTATARRLTVVLSPLGGEHDEPLVGTLAFLDYVRSRRKNETMTHYYST